MLASAISVVSELGYGQMSVARVTAGAGVSRRTFYDIFDDREDCYLAAFEDALARIVELLAPAYRDKRAWRDRVRAALGAFLWLLDEQPGLRALLFVDALKAGPRVLERRAEVLEHMSHVLHDGGLQARNGRQLPPLTGEGVVGAVFSVIHTRLLTVTPGAMLDLLNPLMGMIVLPYLGTKAAEREQQLAAPKIGSVPEGDGHAGPHLFKDPLSELQMRITYRTLRVLTAIDERPGVSNREVSLGAGVADQGQISKLLARLEGLGLIENRGGGRQPTGEPNAWHLTALGQDAQQAIEAQPSRTDRQVNGTRESH
jgi:AcrR family transcriptional regulator/DNA-binding MarR family transcriptional regulator